MKLLLLVIITTWSFGGGYQKTPSFHVVSTPQEASILVLQNEFYKKGQVEPDHHVYRLIEIDLDKLTVIEIPIPDFDDILPDRSIIIQPLTPYTD